MSFINYSSREINCKIVYYGPGLCGKTTNLQYIYNKTNPEAKGKMISLATETERTLFFDFLPLSLGEIRGFKTRFHLYTVPGQVFYDASRKLILKGVDGVVFVGDSQMERMEANIESLENLRANLQEQGYDLDKLPYVVQYNKRDLPNAIPMAELEEALNPTKVPSFEAVRAQGHRRVRHAEGGREARAHRAAKGRMMQAAGSRRRPRFRQDLVAEPIEEHGAKFIDVMDPDSGNVFRFYEVEYSIACAMDGERDVAGIVQWAAGRARRSTPIAERVRTVIATLGELGYLDQTGAARAAAAAVATPDSTTDRPTHVVATGPARTRAASPGPAAMEIDAHGDTVSQTSEVSIDLSDHIAVGPADVQEAVRQSRVMAAIEVPDDLDVEVSVAPAAAPAVQTPVVQTPVVQAPPVATPPVRAPEVQPPPVAVQPVATPPIERPMARPQTPLPVEPVATPPVATPPVAADRPARPQTPPTGEPVIAKPADVRKPAVELPKVPDKQPVLPPEPTPRTSPVLIVLLILVLLGGAAFAVWKFVLDKPAPEPGPVTGSAAVAPQPPSPPEPPPKPAATAKIELSSGRPKTILAFFPGTIEWIETSGKEAKSNDVIMKLVGAKPLEAQVEALKKDVEKRNTELQAVYKARDAAQAAGDEAGVKKAQTKIDELEKVYNAKSDQLNAKTDQLEPFLVRLLVDGTLTITRKVGDKIPENTPIATILPAPELSATFKIPAGTKLELGTAAAVRLGEKLVTCVVADWEPESLRMTCPKEPGVVEGAVVTWELP